MQIGKRVAQLRAAHGESLRDAAARTGVSHTTISRIEKGDVTASSNRTLRKIADGYSVPVGWLLTGRDPRPNLAAQLLTQAVVAEAGQYVDVVRTAAQDGISPGQMKQYLALARKAIQAGVGPGILDMAVELMARVTAARGEGRVTLQQVDPQPKPLYDRHYQDADTPQVLAAALMEQFKAEDKGAKYMPVFVLVGANSSTGDALGPFIGWFLQRKGFTGEYLGDLSAPVHATNIKETENEAWLRAMKRDKFPYIIAVDAAVGRPGWITLNGGPLKPGAGIGKTLPAVGAVHIMGGTAKFPFEIWFAGLDQTVAMAEVIADGLMQFYDSWSRLSQVV